MLNLSSLKRHRFRKLFLKRCVLFRGGLYSWLQCRNFLSCFWGSSSCNAFRLPDIILFQSNRSRQIDFLFWTYPSGKTKSSNAWNSGIGTVYPGYNPITSIVRIAQPWFPCDGTELFSIAFYPSVRDRPDRL